MGEAASGPRFLHMKSRSVNYGRLPEVATKDETGISPPPTKQLAWHVTTMGHSIGIVFTPFQSIASYQRCLFDAV